MDSGEINFKIAISTKTQTHLVQKMAIRIPVLAMRTLILNTHLFRVGDSIGPIPSKSTEQCHFIILALEFLRNGKWQYTRIDCFDSNHIK